ncbi:glycerol-3-phosphate dehydrogenase [Nereida sp. MMG025]|uniref:glycerol-3-phosphate dehydrogenase n=1 Tax=Nereida sp. MMG025 TaxID=2909981 RepID=UPI001F02D060|nr:glycerol-3-phosphate dehydrogenase [Nereida sp. MMG025]MCF6443358.1 glycerol-3-phosphate dehydrogenase [Nereida sp. MMG025]
MTEDNTLYDLFVIGGGVNGCGIARDAQGRGLKVALAEMNDLGWATSSSSTKLFHGGLRYLEFFEFRLVRESLIERETLLKAMPHISWPMRFVLPFHKDMRFESDTPTSKLLSFVMPWMKGRRPAWLIRLGLFLYDNMGGRKVLPGTKTVDLTRDPVGAPLDDRFAKAFEYSDCWVEDSRLVILNARDAQARGAKIMPRTKVVSADRRPDHWEVTLEDGAVIRAKCLVNAAGPWVEDVIRGVVRQNTSEGVRLVRGSHIVTRKLFDHDKCYFFQGEDGRIIFAIPYEYDFTLIGTTDAEHTQADTAAEISDAERDYLIDFINNYLKKDISPKDIVWTYSGVRPLYDDGASSATAATRDYVLSLDEAGAPVLNIFGGKITTYRKLAKHALAKLDEIFPQMGSDWTAGVAMPGGDFPVDGVDALVAKLQGDYPFLIDRHALRLIRAYGTEAWDVLGDAKIMDDLGKHFGATLSEREVRWQIANEFVTCADDVLWRRTKLGLHMGTTERAMLSAWFKSEGSMQ